MSQFNPSETELLYRLFSSEDFAADESAYPWNPADPEAETYFAAQDETFNLDDWSAAELQASTQSFFSRLDACWPSTDLVQLLSDKFAARIPQAWLARVAAEATKVIENQTHQASQTANQLIACVQELLPAWEEDDLMVLARPYAYAMRSDASAEDLNSLARAIDWTELSPMEQAKLTMVATKYALEHLEQ
jgi:hypothetical protein